MQLTKVERYMSALWQTGTTPYDGFLGAYNLGVWGVSVSGKAALEQGLLVSGSVLTRTPQWTMATVRNPRAENFVKWYDTPSLWGFGDENLGMSKGLYNSVMHACAVLGINPEGGLTSSEVARVRLYIKQHIGLDWNGVLGGDEDLFADIATKSEVQWKMDQVGAWTQLVNRWQAVIAQSRYLVDITSLSAPVSGSEAQIGICRGISTCLKRWILNARQNPGAAPFLMIRLMFGMSATQIPKNPTNWEEFYNELQSTLKPLRPHIARVVQAGAQAPVVLYGSDMGRKPANFNHSKIVAGDGQYAVVGGHNMCEEVSSNRAPCIHDITCEVTGPGARTANAFATSLFLKAAESGRLWLHRFSWQKNSFEDLSTEATKRWAPKNWWAYELGDQKEVAGVLRNQYWYYPMETLPAVAAHDPPPGSVPATAIMGIGRWGDTKVFGVDCTGGLKLNTAITANHACQYASDYLKRHMINDTKNTIIRMSQQDLVNAGKFGGMQASKHTICEILGKRLLKTPRGTAIQVVVSSRFTQNSEGLAYSYGDGPREAAERISDTVVNVPQESEDIDDLPPRLQILDLDAQPGSAPTHAIVRRSDPSFCTVAPLAFCEARGTTRDRGSYVWPDAQYVNSMMGGLYANGRYWNKADGRELRFGPGNHAKVMCVSEGDDDSTALVMIGSDNMYPSPLSEFNFVIEGTEAIRAFRRQYWDRLWGYSARLGFTVAPDGNIT